MASSTPDTVETNQDAGKKDSVAEKTNPGTAKTDSAMKTNPGTAKTESEEESNPGVAKMNPEVKRNNEVKTNPGVVRSNPGVVRMNNEVKTNSGVVRARPDVIRMNPGVIRMNNDVQIVRVARNERPTRRSNKRTLAESKEDDMIWLQKVCNEISTAEEQIPLIVQEIEAKSQYYKCVALICQDLFYVLRFFYQGFDVKILPFGSAIMNLALKNSDVDIYLDFGSELPQPAHKLTKHLRNKILKKGVFQRVIPILAKVPIVRCITHGGTTCDISFMNRHGVVNSHLIKTLLNFNEKIRPLIMILKHVLKKEGLVGTNCLTSFAVVILVVYFLQQLDKRILPSIKEMQDLIPTQDNVGCWNTAYSADINRFRISKISEYTTVELLKKFFEFYAKFEFAFYVISPYTGRKHLKPVFADLDVLSEEFISYKENVIEKLCSEFELNKFMCVQDPFNHSCNITRGITQAKVLEFQKFCEKSVDICNEELRRRDEKDYNSIFFIKLFTQNWLLNEKKKMVKSRVITIYPDKTLDCKDAATCTEDSLRNMWSKTILEKIVDILTNILKCKVDTVSKEQYYLKSLEYKDSDIVALLQCELQHFDLVSKRRSEVKQILDLPPTMSILDQEELISKRMCETIIKLDHMSPFKFEAICYVDRGPTCFCINLQSEGKGIHRQMEQQFFKFMKFFLPRLIGP